MGETWFPPGSEPKASDAHAARPERELDALLGRQLGVDLREGALRVDHRVAELDERVARHEMPGGVVDGREARVRHRAELLAKLEDDPLRRLLPDSGDRLEACVVAERDRLAELAGRRAGHDRERDLGADAARR